MFPNIVGTTGGGGAWGGTRPFSPRNLIIFCFKFHLLAYNPDIKLKTFSIIFDDPEGHGGGHAHF